jgi:hypothetical protein
VVILFPQLHRIVKETCHKFPEIIQRAVTEYVTTIGKMCCFDLHIPTPHCITADIFSSDLMIDLILLKGIESTFHAVIGLF